MSVHRDTVTFSASEVKTNLLTGLPMEINMRPAKVTVYASQILVAQLELDLQIGNTSIGRGIKPGVAAAGVLVTPDHRVFSTVAAPGDRIQLRAVELTGAVATNGLTFMVEIAELA